MGAGRDCVGTEVVGWTEAVVEAACTWKGCVSSSVSIASVPPRIWYRFRVDAGEGVSSTSVLARLAGVLALVKPWFSLSGFSHRLPIP